MDPLQTKASAFLVLLFRNFANSEPQNVPRIPATTVMPPNAIADLKYNNSIVEPPYNRYAWDPLFVLCREVVLLWKLFCIQCIY